MGQCIGHVDGAGTLRNTIGMTPTKNLEAGHLQLCKLNFAEDSNISCYTTLSRSGVRTEVNWTGLDSPKRQK